MSLSIKKYLKENVDFLVILDNMDLDEEVVDEKVGKLIESKSLSITQLRAILVYLKYKYLICLQEETNCDNDVYIDFAIKLLMSFQNMEEENKLLLQILTTSLLMNREKIQNYSEHVLQQLLACQEFQTSLKVETSKSPMPLHIINTILETCLIHEVTLFPFFLNNEFEKLLQKQCDIVNINFYSNTIPMLMEVCRDYTLLNVIWDNILSRLRCNTNYDFIIMCTLSEYYLPVTSITNTVKVKSSVVKKVEFWKMIQYGLLHDDYIVRKCSIYLAKRAVLSCQEKTKIVSKVNITAEAIFSWNNEKASFLKEAWSSLFVLLETLEEKQSQLVLSSLKLFDCISDIHHSWYYVALVRALSHNANTVVLEATRIALTKAVILEDYPYCKLLEALNNMYLYEYFDDREVNSLQFILINFLQKKDCLMNVMKNMSVVKLAPVPKFYVYSVIGNILIQDSRNIQLSSIIEIFLSDEAPTNNILIDYSIKCYSVDFIMNHKLVRDIHDLFHVVGALNNKTPILAGNILWNKLLSFVKTCSEYMDMETSSLLIFWNECVTSTTNIKSLAVFLLLMVQANIIPKDFLNKVLYGFINHLKVSNDFHERVLFIMSSIVEEISNPLENYGEYERSEIWTEEAHKLVLLKITELLNNGDDYSIENILYCLEVFILNTIVFEKSGITFDAYIKHAKYILSSEANTKVEKYIGLKIISCIVQAISKISWSSIEKYSMINPLFKFVTESNEILKRHVDHGAMLSRFNEEIIKIYIENYGYLDEWNFNVKTKLYEDILQFLEVGGYGCLLYVIKLSKILLQNVSTDLSNDKIRFLIDFTWKEIFAIRKSGNFKFCLSGFIKMVYQTNLLQDSSLSQVLLEYSDIIYEFSDQVPVAAYELIHHIYYSDISQKVILSNILCKALVFGTPLRKDQRMEQNITNKILTTVDNPSRNKFYKEFLEPMSHVRMIALSILMKQDMDFHTTIMNHLTIQLDSLYKPNSRYHGNSLHHRILLRTLQFMCITSALYKHTDSAHCGVKWCIERLISQPHHTSSKILLEWYISLYIVNNDISLSETNLTNLNLENVPQISYFTILYHVAKHRLTEWTQGKSENVTNCVDEKVENDLEFVINILLQYTMGQLFNIRLHVQYYIMMLLDIVKGSMIYSKYSLFVDTIKKTFDLNKTDKSLLKLQQDFYINNIDVVHSLSVINIYNSVLRLTNVSEDEWISLDIMRSEEYVNLFCNLFANDDVLMQTTTISIAPKESHELPPSPDNKTLDNKNIQKKFVPWQKILSDIGITPEIVDDTPQCELIVVASLIDRLPNLGGLSRTCEVFGVKRYVISSLSYLQDKQFQSTSMSSEKWLDITEKIPGKNLKEYLLQMKNNGYDVIAAEQTSSSISLKSFKFPKKSLLLVGHEKDGIPCDLICLMDHCVEIPQYGMVRSLNVHVTASIFIWEYVKQHPLGP